MVTEPKGQEPPARYFY